MVPSLNPSGLPTEYPSTLPSQIPSASPTFYPSQNPSSKPSQSPSRGPSSQPSSPPSNLPSLYPSSVATESLGPSNNLNAAANSVENDDTSRKKSKTFPTVVVIVGGCSFLAIVVLFSIYFVSKRRRNVMNRNWEDYEQDEVVNCSLADDDSSIAMSYENKRNLFSEVDLNSIDIEINSCLDDVSCLNPSSLVGLNMNQDKNQGIDKTQMDIQTGMEPRGDICIDQIYKQENPVSLAGKSNISNALKSSASFPKVNQADADNPEIGFNGSCHAVSMGVPVELQPNPNDYHDFHSIEDKESPKNSSASKFPNVNRTETRNPTIDLHGLRNADAIGVSALDVSALDVSVNFSSKLNDSHGFHSIADIESPNVTSLERTNDPVKNQFLEGKCTFNSRDEDLCEQKGIQYLDRDNTSKDSKTNDTLSKEIGGSISENREDDLNSIIGTLHNIMDEMQSFLGEDVEKTPNLREGLASSPEKRKKSLDPNIHEEGGGRLSDETKNKTFSLADVNADVDADSWWDTKALPLNIDNELKDDESIEDLCSILSSGDDYTRQTSASGTSRFSERIAKSPR